MAPASVGRPASPLRTGSDNAGSPELHSCGDASARRAASRIPDSCVTDRILILRPTAAGAVSTTTRRSPSPHADSWSSSGVRFPLRLTLVWRALAWRLLACRLPSGYASGDPNGRVELKPSIPASVTIRALRRHLLERRFAVPKLQRNFVWDAGRAAKHLDRIYREMPIYGYSD
jgi:hypothetical protein